MGVLFTFLDVTVPGTTGGGRDVMDGVLALVGLPNLTVLSYLLLVMAALFTLAHMLAYYLMFQKQVFGLFMMIGLDLVGFLLWPLDAAALFVTAVLWLVLGLPWLLVWIDLRRRGELFP